MSEIVWIVYFAFTGLSLDLTEGVFGRWHATFPDRETCKAWIAEVDRQEPRKIKIVSECQMEMENE
jgi:hypothetical protein